MNFSSVAATFDSSAIAPAKWNHCRAATLNPRRNFVICAVKPQASASLRVAESAASDSVSRIGSLSQVSGVLGSQWGDEGKGKLVDILAEHFNIVARCQVYSFVVDS